jgi:hypothetical protein
MLNIVRKIAWPCRGGLAALCCLTAGGLHAVGAGSSNENGMTANRPDLTVPQQVKTVFVVALENHDLVQANSDGGPQQLLGNPAAPYFNSLITPGNSNATQVSFATHYFSVALGEHPSEPNYIWSEAGTEFGVYTDADPSPAAGNVFSNVMHLSGQLMAAGIPWRSYQEDLQYGPGPAESAWGAGVPVNPYNGTTEYAYAVKHNPMEFFPDTQNTNCFPLTNFWTDLTNQNIGRYNWITPDLLNDMHSALPGGFVYRGFLYTGDQAAVAEGDNFLSLIIPQIMATAAYQDKGMIILWMDETESTDDTNTSLPCVVISPLAKGNAYASTLPYSHSSDLKTMDEIFGLAWQTNAIPIADLDAQNTAYNDVAGSSAIVYDLGDLLQAGAITGSPPNGVVEHPALSAAGFQLTFSGPTNQTYALLATSDLVRPFSTWTVVGTGTFAGREIVFTETNTAGHSVRYYVVKSP